MSHSFIAHGFVYECCLARPIGNPNKPTGLAQHYAGATPDVPAREDVHRGGGDNAARLLVAAKEQGVDWRIVRVYRLPTMSAAFDLEGVLKARSHAPRRCPHCIARAAGQPVPVEVEYIDVPDVQALCRQPVQSILQKLSAKRRRAKIAKLHKQNELIPAELIAWDSPYPTAREADGVSVQVYDLRPLPAVAWDDPLGF